MATLKNTTINDTGYLKLPSGTTAQRPSSPAIGYMRWNTTENYVEVYTEGQWVEWPFEDNFVTNGLKLRLEASDYPGSGTTWTDSAQSISFSSVGTQTPYTTVGGSPCFDFNSSGYWQSGAGASSSNLVDMRVDFTLIMLFYAETPSTRRTIFEKAGTSYQSYEQEIACTFETDRKITWYRGYNTYDYAQGYTLTNSNWNFWSIKSEGSTTRTGHYWNTSTNTWVSDYNSRGSNTITQSGAIRVGTGYAGTMDNGYVGSVLVYNRALTSDEMQTLYNYYSTQYTNLV